MMPKRIISLKSIILLLYIVFQVSNAFSQNIKSDKSDFNPELGNYFINNYSRAFLNNSNTNFAVLQDQDGVMYIGNVADGITIYDGQRISRVLTKNRLPLKGISKDIVMDSKKNIYASVGSVNYGYIEKNEFGESIYTSLSELLPEKDKVSSVVWGVVVWKDTVFFQSEKKVYLYKYKKLLKIIDFENPSHIIQQTPKGVYLRVWNDGIYKYEKGDFHLITSSKKEFSQNRIDGMYLLDNGEHLIVSRNIGGWILSKDDSEVRKAGSDELDKIAIEGKSYKGNIVTKNGYIPITTSEFGLVFFDQKLKIKSVIDTKNGLNDGHITSYMIDRTGDVWGTSAELFKLSFDSSITYFSKLNGIHGDVNNIARINGKLYLQTRDDFFEFVPKSKLNDYSKFISKGVKEAGYQFIPFGKQIITTNNYSIKSNEGDKVKVVSNVYRSRFSVQSKLNPSLLFSSNYAYGLQIHQYKNGNWSNIPVKSATNLNCVGIVEPKPGHLILTSTEGPIYSYQYNASGQGKFTKFQKNKSFTSKERYRLQVFNDSLYFAYDTLTNFYRFDFEKNQLIYTGINFQKLNGIEGFAYSYNKDSKNGWILINNKLYKIKIDLKNGYLLVEYPFYKVDYSELSMALFAEGNKNNEVLWIGSQDERLFRYLPEIAKHSKAKVYDVLLRAVYSNNQKVAIKIGKLNYDQNNLVFEFAYPVYGNETKTTFSYWLEGQDDEWTDFIADTKKEYTNLQEGKYTIHVKAKDASGVISNEYIQQFRILPPWYRSIWAYLVYLGLLIYSFILFGKYQAKKSFKKSEEDRKSAELEAAKDLQNRLLPKETPRVNNLDIAGYLKTSTEVGGDYYDFFKQEDESVYIIGGDATGHGTPAGMLVSITKAGIIGLPKMDPDKMLFELNKVVKKVDLGILRMSLNIAYVEGDKLTLSSAGMPPFYIYRKETNSVEEILIKGVPLGSFYNAEYDQIITEFKQGDVLAIISDGMPEAPNLKGELFSYKRIEDLMLSLNSKSAQEIIEAMNNEIEIWLSGKHTPDDITIVIIKHL